MTNPLLNYIPVSNVNSKYFNLAPGLQPLEYCGHSERWLMLTLLKLSWSIEMR